MLDAGLRQKNGNVYKLTDDVLILIMLDAGLRLVQKRMDRRKRFGLNPYYVGCWSQTYIL